MVQTSARKREPTSSVLFIPSVCFRHQWQSGMPKRNCTRKNHALVIYGTRTARIQASSAPIPDSLNSACEHARNAITAALSSGKRRLFVEIDTTQGDATYTMLKNSTPVTKNILPALKNPYAGRVVVLLPDSGAAALMLRDWDTYPPGAQEATENQDMPQKFEVLGIEQYELKETDSGIVMAVPRASEVDRMEAIVDSAGDIPVVVVNPDLVDMGVTGLSLNARKLRERFVNTFESVYFLKVYGWGVLLRAFPGKWGIWVDDPSSPVGFRLVGELEDKPTSEDIESVLRSAGRESSGKGPLETMMRGLSRFLSVYTKG